MRRYARDVPLETGQGELAREFLGQHFQALVETCDVLARRSFLRLCCNIKATFREISFPITSETRDLIRDRAHTHTPEWEIPFRSTSNHSSCTRSEYLNRQPPQCEDFNQSNYGTKRTFASVVRCCQAVRRHIYVRQRPAHKSAFSVARLLAARRRTPWVSRRRVSGCWDRA